MSVKMFAWMGWTLFCSIHSMALRVFFMFVDDYWFSWWKDNISNFPILCFTISFLICLPLPAFIINQLQNISVPPPLSSSLSSLELFRNQIPDTPSSIPDSSISVIDKQFCSSSKIELTITGKIDKNLSVMDENGNIIFKIEEKKSRLHVRRILVDNAGRPILSLVKKIKSLHNKWEAFKGESPYDEDILFTSQQSSMVQLRTKLEVFMKSNTNAPICDFLVKGSRSDKSCMIYGAGRSDILAEMYRLDNDTYTVIVYPNIDYAFIVILIFVHLIRVRHFANVYVF